jgi:hypothetical protein
LVDFRTCVSDMRIALIQAQTVAIKNNGNPEEK